MTSVDTVDGLAAARRRYLFALADSGGTLPPELGVARRLAARGHHVTVLGPEGARIASDDIDYRAWSRPWPSFDDWSPRSPMALARAMADGMIAGPAAMQADDVRAAIDSTQPDLVLTSFVAIGAMTAAESRGVPYDVLIPNVYPMPAEGLPPFGTGLRPMRGPLGRLRDRMLNRTAARLMDRYALGRLNEVRTREGLSPLDTVFAAASRARRQLLLTSRAFDFPGQLPHTARYVGPILDDPAWADTSWRPPEGGTLSCLWRCRRRSKTSVPACSASSMLSPVSRCAVS